jgi:exopolyphosphatase/guanosine-5'-triphosphate,3'-diphosphate pyrophosphatase
VLSHRRSLKKVQSRIEGAVDMRTVLALRLAALFHRGRSDMTLPTIQARYLEANARFRIAVDSEWLARNPLTANALRSEIVEWGKVGFELLVPGLDASEAAAQRAVAA